jgi:DNA repair protein RecO (recombination protein O)
MQWQGRGIILSSSKYSETSLIVRFFSAEKGVFAGMVRGGASKKNLPIYQIGNIIDFTWSARLEEHLGNFRAELVKSHFANVINSHDRMMALSSLMQLVVGALPERDPHAEFFTHIEGFLHKLSSGDDWVTDYIKIEMELLNIVGFGLDLSCCAATNSKFDLIYVSPKSGRAVSREAGQPYADKLLNLPNFLIANDQPANDQEIVDGLDLSGYFLDKYWFAPKNKKLPTSRDLLINNLKRACK